MPTPPGLDIHLLHAKLIEMEYLTPEDVSIKGIESVLALLIRDVQGSKETNGKYFLKTGILEEHGWERIQNGDYWLWWSEDSRHTIAVCKAMFESHWRIGIAKEHDRWLRYGLPEHESAEQAALAAFKRVGDKERFTALEKSLEVFPESKPITEDEKA